MITSVGIVPNAYWKFPQTMSQAKVMLPMYKDKNIR